MCEPFAPTSDFGVNIVWSTLLFVTGFFFLNDVQFPLRLAKRFALSLSLLMI